MSDNADNSWGVHLWHGRPTAKYKNHEFYTYGAPGGASAETKLCAKSQMMREKVTFEQADYSIPCPPLSAVLVGWTLVLFPHESDM